MTYKFLIIPLAAFLFAGIVSAEPRHRDRQKRQNARIAQGVHSGELTRKETKKLARAERNLHRDIPRNKADGPGLTPRERVRIEKRQDRLSRQIAQQKHDNQQRSRARD